MNSGQVAFAMDHSGHSGYNRAAMCHGHYWDADQLYDLHHDPDEQINLATRPDNQAVLQDMKQRLERHLKQFHHPYPREADPYQTSKEFWKLVEKTKQDDSYFTRDWYQKGAW